MFNSKKASWLLAYLRAALVACVLRKKVHPVIWLEDFLTWRHHCD